jgi:predicted metal-dependent hydrolase
MSLAPPRNQPLLTPPELRARLPELYRALEQFNDGSYFESHDTLEELWRVTPLPDRLFFQGIIQMAAGFVHICRGKYPGTIYLLDASATKLQQFVPERFGVDVAQLLAGVERARDEISALGEERFLHWDAAGVPRIQFIRTVE